MVSFTWSGMAKALEAVFGKKVTSTSLMEADAMRPLEMLMALVVKPRTTLL